ncbi:hypothetical protein EV214_11016 [Marinisporobacter balticus]|uniref:Uncharacterized protein n=1 Tax=Marinisporobacter balticus TaxID=2018667 RepID=A0A4R2L6W7_9FIRM|nr:hypothetical protein EV214_11016 [Marinisporobacter balticus]
MDLLYEAVFTALFIIAGFVLLYVLVKKEII